MIQPEQPITENLRPAIFFDRDGTLIDDIGYLADPSGVNFYPGIPRSLGKLKDQGYLLVIITNQSGIGRGYFDEETAIAVNLAMVKKLGGEGVTVDAVYYCPHQPDEGCSCRKPGTLMVSRAARDLDIDLTRSWVVGDIDKDVLTAMNAGLGSVLVETGKTGKGEIPEDAHRCATVVEAVEYILGVSGR